MNSMPLARTVLYFEHVSRQLRAMSATATTACISAVVAFVKLAVRAEFPHVNSSMMRPGSSARLVKFDEDWQVFI